MNCPCCGEQTNRPFIIIHNTMHMADGTKLRHFPTPLRMFEQLLKGPLPFPTKPSLKQSHFVHISKLREFIKRNSLPYTIKSNDTSWTMTVNRS